MICKSELNSKKMLSYDMICKSKLNSKKMLNLIWCTIVQEENQQDIITLQLHKSNDRSNLDFIENPNKINGWDWFLMNRLDFLKAELIHESGVNWFLFGGFMDIWLNDLIFVLNDFSPFSLYATLAFDPSLCFYWFLILCFHQLSSFFSISFPFLCVNGKCVI